MNVVPDKPTLLPSMSDDCARVMNRSPAHADQYWTESLVTAKVILSVRGYRSEAIDEVLARRRDGKPTLRIMGKVDAKG
jgi:hypothetical protein